MKYYAAAEINITDPSWIGEYIERTTAMVESHGGRYLARTANVERIEGDREKPQIFLLIEWPSRESAMNFYESDEYAPFLRARRRGSSGDFTLASGEDVSGTARMEP